MVYAAAIGTVHSALCARIVTTQRRPVPLIMVEFLESKQLVLQVTSNQEQRLAKMLAPDCPNEPFYKRARILAVASASVSTSLDTFCAAPYE